MTATPTSLSPNAIASNPPTTAPHWPRGFSSGGVAAGIKKPGVNDLALLFGNGEFGNGELSAAAVFTRNLIVAAPIQVSRANLAVSSARIRALIINSGCANAATGEEGLARSRRTIESLAATLGIPSQSVLVNSTGERAAKIGRRKTGHLIGHAQLHRGLVKRRHGLVHLGQQRAVPRVQIIVQIKAAQHHHEHLPFGAQASARANQLGHRFELIGQIVARGERGFERDA